MFSGRAPCDVQMAIGPEGRHQHTQLGIMRGAPADIVLLILSQAARDPPDGYVEQMLRDSHK